MSNNGRKDGKMKIFLAIIALAILVVVVWTFKKTISALANNRGTAAVTHLKSVVMPTPTTGLLTITGNSSDPNSRLVGVFYQQPGAYNFGGKWGGMTPDVILYPASFSPFTTTAKIPAGTHYLVISVPNGIAVWSVQVKDSSGNVIASSDNVDASNPLSFTVK
jgi:hypothetical protein